MANHISEKIRIKKNKKNMKKGKKNTVPLYFPSGFTAPRTSTSFCNQRFDPDMTTLREHHVHTRTYYIHDKQGDTLSMFTLFLYLN
jgi:hypothetical protein